MKICSRCKRQLSYDDFNRCSVTKDGFQYYCKDCQKEHRKNPTSVVVSQQVKSEVFRVVGY